MQEAQERLLKHLGDPAGENRTSHVHAGNRLAASRVQNTIQGAHKVLASLSSQNTTEGLDELVSRWTLVRHQLLLDGAVDRCTAEYLMTQREEGKLAGVALVTDESPPSQPRFRGLRFQISVCYWGSFLDLDYWNTNAEPPMTLQSCLADIVHCPGKNGVDVSRVLEKQLARLGLNAYDVVAGTGDGGGENEGHQGVHAYFENLSPGYVRRRCLHHIDWRTCAAAIRAAGLDYRTLAAYFVEGITWSRLKVLATTPAADGGLGLFRDGSQQCNDVFGKSPYAVLESRPQTDLNFRMILQGH